MWERAARLVRKGGQRAGAGSRGAAGEVMGSQDLRRPGSERGVWYVAKGKKDSCGALAIERCFPNGSLAGDAIHPTYPPFAMGGKW